MLDLRLHRKTSFDYLLYPLEGRDEPSSLEDRLNHFLDPLVRRIADAGVQHQHGLWFAFSDCSEEVPEIVPSPGWPSGVETSGLWSSSRILLLVT
jgi:hypothetical protein